MQPINSSAPPSGALLDRSVRVATADFALHIALHWDRRGPAFVMVTVTLLECHGMSRQWEFPVAIEGRSVVVGNALIDEGEAPLLRVTDGDAAWPAEVDEAFTQAFQVFGEVNRERLIWLGILQRLWPTHARTSGGSLH